MNNDSINTVEPKDVTSEIAGSVNKQSNTAAVKGSKGFSVTVTLKDVTGKCYLSCTNAGAIGRWDFVAIYEGNVPSDPNSGYLGYFYVSEKNSMKMDQGWGNNYIAAYVSYDYELDKYVTLVQTPKTKS
ncbi:MAG: hypothetical protein ACI8ZM_005311 [Crocinitomix sp.]|jgi:hypothetical protein